MVILRITGDFVSGGSLPEGEGERQNWRGGVGSARGTVFVCELIRKKKKKDFQQLNTDSIVFTRPSEKEGAEKGTQRSERGRQSGRQRQRRKNLCKVLIVVSE